MVYRSIKQFLDILFSLFLIIVLSPIFIIIAIIIKIDSEGPIIFSQKRIGKDCSAFYIYKFRTMKQETPKDIPTHLFQVSESFITRPGKFLRKSSLDELPQLINILQGAMSFIGPRPALWNQYDLIKSRENQIERYGVSANSIKPGITGWAQINGRDEISIETKADLDGYYSKNLCFSLDVKILLLTFWNVLLRKGISEGATKR